MKAPIDDSLIRTDLLKKFSANDRYCNVELINDKAAIGTFLKEFFAIDIICISSCQ